MEGVQDGDGLHCSICMSLLKILGTRLLDLHTAVIFIGHVLRYLLHRMEMQCVIVSVICHLECDSEHLMFQLAIYGVL